MSASQECRLDRVLIFLFLLLLILFLILLLIFIFLLWAALLHPGRGLKAR
jgi:hypothetical protein